MARKKKEVTPQPLEVAAPPQDELVEILSRLVRGDRPANEKEHFILFRWTHLTRQERHALAAYWDLPCEQVPNEWLARKIEKDLNRQLRLNRRFATLTR